MKEESLLKDFFNDRIWCQGMRRYEELTEEEKLRIEKTTSFSVYKLRIARKSLIEEINNIFKNVF